MTPALRTIVPLLAAVAGLCVAPPRAAAGQSTGAPPLETFTLENELEVLVWPDPTVPVVSVELWYDVGSADEGEDTQGFAHLFEHLLQGPTRALEAGEGRSLIRSVGGESGASSNPDRTAFSTRLPAHRLELALWIEAQRMGALRLDQAALDQARTTVAGEWRGMQQETDPLRRLRAASWMLSRGPSSAHPPLGDPAEMERRSLDEVRRFGSRYLGPSNAALAVVGDVDPATVRTLVAKHFGDLSPGRVPDGRDRISGPPYDRHQAHLAGPGDGTPVAVLHAWHVPAADHEDIPALAVLAELLQPDRAQAMAAAAVWETAVAGPPASVELQTGVDPGFLGVLLPTRGERGTAALRSSLEAGLIEPLLDSLSESRVAAARGRLQARLLDARATGLGRARLLQEARRTYGDATRWDAVARALPRVSAAQVQEVARRYLVWENSSTLTATSAAGSER